MNYLHFLFLIIFSSCAALTFAESAPTPLSVEFDVRHAYEVADFSKSLGGGIDGHDAGETEKMLSPGNVAIMRRSGLQSLAYRLRTELGIEAWHWNPVGTWSDERHQQGYWTSSKKNEQPITASYGYRLPRRGDTLDEANNDSYSRLDDGDPNTFWKSNPYLTSYYTGEADAAHPQWVILDFGKPVFINAARLHWKQPYAKKFRIQYGRGDALYFGQNHDWHDFPKGNFTNASGGALLLDLETPRTFFGKVIPVRYVRILMTENSQTCAASGADSRDSMGYALGEIEVGFLQNQIFHDVVIHRPDQGQTLTYVSSTDPWHRACDVDSKTEQPGLDAVVASGLDNHQPILWSVPFFYDTPENAAALVAFLKTRGALFPTQRVELGEEPDGQRVDPKDVGELYAQTALRIHQAHPKLILGGLSFVTIDVQRGDFIYRVDKRPWLRRFFKQLQKKGARDQFQFCTFEWYPFDDLLLPAEPLLIEQPRRLQEAVTRLRHGGVPKTMPLLITEYGYSVFSGEPEVKMPAALLNADIVAQFLCLSGATSYLYGYEPNRVECGFGDSWGNLMMLLQTNGDNVEPLPTYYAAQLVARAWGAFADGPCNIIQARTSALTPKGDPFVTAYLLVSKHHGKERRSLLLVNKSRTNTYELRCRFSHFGKSSALSSTWDGFSYSPNQYRWKADGKNGHPLFSHAPACTSVFWKQNGNGSTGRFYEGEQEMSILPWSITVLREKN